MFCTCNSTLTFTSTLYLIQTQMHKEYNIVTWFQREQNVMAVQRPAENKKILICLGGIENLHDNYQQMGCVWCPVYDQRFN